MQFVPTSRVLWGFKYTQTLGSESAPNPQLFRRDRCPLLFTIYCTAERQNLTNPREKGFLVPETGSGTHYSTGRLAHLQPKIKMAHQIVSQKQAKKIVLCWDQQHPTEGLGALSNSVSLVKRRTPFGGGGVVVSSQTASHWVGHAGHPCCRPGIARNSVTHLQQQWHGAGYGTPWAGVATW